MLTQSSFFQGGEVKENLKRLEKRFLLQIYCTYIWGLKLGSRRRIATGFPVGNKRERRLYTVATIN